MNSHKNLSIYTLFAILLSIPFLSYCELANSEDSLQFGEFVHALHVNENRYQLVWGKNGFRNISAMSYDSNELRNARLVTESNDFAVIKIDGDPVIRKSIILPLNMKSAEIIYKNAICIDLETQTIISELPSQDTVLIAENFINKKKMILDNLIPCQSGSAHDCLDSLVLNKNRLSFKWITPQKHSVDKKVELKRFKIRLK
jgi:hypothetical protein